VIDNQHARYVAGAVVEVVVVVVVAAATATAAVVVVWVLQGTNWI